MLEKDVKAYQDQGFVIVENAFDPEDPLLMHLQTAYIHLIDTLFSILCLDTRPPPGFDFSDATSLSKKVAILIGMGGQDVFDHINPYYGTLKQGYRFRNDFPSAQFQQLFNLFICPMILDSVEYLLGSEFRGLSANLLIKLSPTDKALMRQNVSHNKEVGDARNKAILSRQIGDADWYIPAMEGSKTALESNIANVWIPLGQSTGRNGGIDVLRESHKFLHRNFPHTDERRNRVTLKMSKGDVAFTHNRLFHAQIANMDEADELAPFWVVQLSFVGAGDPICQPNLPSFVARSQDDPSTELHNPVLWEQMWRSALNHYSRFDGVDIASLNNAECQTLEQKWQKYHNQHESWLSLQRTPNKWNKFERFFVRYKY